VSSEGSTEFTLEQALERLEEIARRLEAGELELAESLELFEEGVRLLRSAESVLGAAEERVQRLSADGDGFRLDPLAERS
jgi:exodeoxyribonuclease VII small subunit